MSNLQINPFAAEHHTFITKLSPQQCRERLEAQRVPLFWAFKRMHIPSESQVAGRISEQSFSIYRYTHYRNSFKTVASGELRLESGGTRIAVRLSLHPWVVTFMMFYLAFALLIETIVLLAGVFFFGTRAGPPFLLELAPLALSIWAVAIYVMGRRTARGDDRFLLKFLKESLEAEEISA